MSGFSDYDAPVTALTTYLSSSWLTTTEINQQLDLLRLRARLQLLPPKFEIVDTHFFPKIVEVYQKDRSTYDPELPPTKNRHIWNIGQELANPESVKQFVCGVFNIKNLHWVCIVIDAEHNNVLYGNSMGCFDKQVEDEMMVAVRWWAALHLKCDLNGGCLPITCQADNFSCGVCAINAIQNFIFPQEPLLLPHEAVTERYRWCLNVFGRHTDFVSHFNFFVSQGFNKIAFQCSSLEPEDDANTVVTYKRVPVLGDRYTFERVVISIPHITESESTTPIDDVASQSLPITKSLSTTSVRVPSKRSPDIAGVQDTSRPIKQQKKLNNWFKPGTDDDVWAYHYRTQLEWEERQEETKQDAEEHRQAAKRHSTKLATKRKRRQRAKLVDEDIKLGRRDSTGKLIKAKVNILHWPRGLKLELTIL